ncbi:efflux RND transporter permease subunit [Neptunomonas japonica]|uniref:RND family efflux transporter integral membrane protein n=1 Tax=Neptunomonas japonica JAMM 1380 TaxID=1441457 RepID=A0A7R6PUA7_9GAMM|nr:efflux RND transporter permease subunit [Neptunomonas japonica]BBB29608.1 RND family efflux transporter integral membrane protein [Neptunomonas japonica JAMM 1380]
MDKPLGFSGAIANRFMRSQLTPLLALVGLLMGVFAALVTPREEEPQINVTMANVMVPFPGASVTDVEALVSTPLEQVLGEIKDMEHVYSVSSPGMAVLTVQYKVGVERTEALVRLYNAVYSNMDWRPANLGVGPIIVKPKGIDDVPIVALTLHSSDMSRGAYELRQVAHALEAELKRVPGTRDIETIGGPEQTVRVLLDPQKMAARNISITELKEALILSNIAVKAGAFVGDNKYTPVTAGTFFSTRDDLIELVVGMVDGRPVYLQDIAAIKQFAAENKQYVWFAEKGTKVSQPAVTLTVSKKPGENAVDIANHVLERVEHLKGHVIPQGVEVTITRNYGKTANDKANKLIQKLIFATLSVIALVFLALGRREAIVVGAAVVLTLMVTLFASWAWGFTLNRVSLFALIFSIGILVDDAIVVVENIHRHMALDNKTLLEAIPIAVDEVGGPTILATFTVIAALLPMAFVSGLMGPYMSPIPINASMGMLLSLIIAFTFTPWLCHKLLKHNVSPQQNHTSVNTSDKADVAESRLYDVFKRLMMPFLGAGKRLNRYLLGFSLIALIAGAIGLGVMQLVILKMLPFDNKSEFQVVVDMPEGTTLEQTNRVLFELTSSLLNVDEVENVQAYAGTASPIGFNGLVRQYYLRQAANQGDLQVNLADKKQRDRSSHEIALSVRPQLIRIAEQFSASVKVIEVPPGPPVMAPLVAEVYGPDYKGQVAKARELESLFKKTSGLVDIDTSIEANADRVVFEIDRSKAARLGISQADVVSSIAAALGGEDVTYLHTGHAKYPIPVRLELPIAGKADANALLDIKLRSRSGKLIPLSEVVTVLNRVWEKNIYHKDLLPVVYITGDMAGQQDSPLYGMFDMVGKIKKMEQTFISQPEHQYDYSVKWDGEWQITYETFRDMGAAYSVGLILIYLLVVAQFGSYMVPLVIMAPIPLTMIGIMPGHALLNSQFTATSMIGMIALAGIIVRNSILLVDFINHLIARGVALEEAVVSAASVRAKPIILTAVAAMMGAFFILDDPIFNGLAVSLIFGLLVSTLLTLVVIPLLYYSLLRRR